MAEYDVKVQIRVPKSRNPQTGSVKYAPSGYGMTSVKVEASSPEEAKKLAIKSEKVTAARNSAARGLDYDMPKPRASVLEVSRSSSKSGGSRKLSGRGGGAIDQDPLAAGKRGIGRLPKKMNKGGYVNCGASTKPNGKSRK